MHIQKEHSSLIVVDTVKFIWQLKDEKLDVLKEKQEKTPEENDSSKAKGTTAPNGSSKAKGATGPDRAFLPFPDYDNLVIL